MSSSLSASVPSLSDALDRAIGMTTAPVYDFVLRGVDGISSIWVAPLRLVWVRENETKPYYPGIVIKETSFDPNPNGPKTQSLHNALGEANRFRIPPSMQKQIDKNEATIRKLSGRSVRMRNEGQKAVRRVVQFHN